MARDAAETAEGMRWLGPARYDVAGLWHILKNKRNEATIGVSDALEGSFEEEHKDYLMMFAQNTRCSGRAFAFTPLAQLDDGMFGVVVCDKEGVSHQVIVRRDEDGRWTRGGRKGVVRQGETVIAEDERG